jgi:hypothetical protein
MTLRQDLTIRQGATWSHTHIHKVSGSPVDLTGYSARMRIAKWYDGFGEAYLSTGSDARGGTISLDASGNIALSMTPAETASLAGNLSELILIEPLPATKRYVEFVYDLEIESPGGVITRVLVGRVMVEREVLT